MKCYRCNEWDGEQCQCKDGQTIFHGDCRELLPELPKVDLVLTDPPYGIAGKWTGGCGGKGYNGWLGTHLEKKDRNSWDQDIPTIDTLLAVVSLAKHAILWGGNYFGLPPSRCWLVWNKPERGFTLAEAELAWTNADSLVRVFDRRRHESSRQHPTQKPLALMKWCLRQKWSDDAGTVLDPFLGSGTTLLACKELNRQGIGIELEEKYCEIAANRLKQGVLDFN